VDLVALTQQIVKVYWQTAEQRAIRLHAAQPAVVVLCDANRIERVLDNLLSNAIKYSPQGGPITINLRTIVPDEPPRPGTVWAVLTVRDEGIGIPEDALPRIFEQFYRAENVVGRIAGTGIGLAGARRIVEQHGGTIGITSKQGVGTTVTLRLPLSGPYAVPRQE
jgi:signal transduction histidine kinase